MHWQTARYRIDLARPRVMGIVNITPDSFSDGGRYRQTRQAIDHCEHLVAQGADILDLGGESSRPGTPPVALDEELARLLPVLREAVAMGVPVSVDTYKPEVMRQALDLGADIVNDIWALQQPGAVDVVAAHPSCGVCLMHMHGEPQTMQRTPMEGDAVPQVRDFLAARSQELAARGVAPHRIVWDAGIGFGKTVAQNFALLARQRELLDGDHALLAGWSRKSSLGQVTGLPVNDRVAASVAAAVLAVERGARIVRVHDVHDTVAALKVWAATHHNDEVEGSMTA
ncbi:MULTISPECIES: dihydropteroate synthase [Ramlibacter]|uniref:Dihydropteroate synthase n=1 Tax=Ramlibacter pinisoli TaxID=2682844 RepID=A0A6N8IWT3_9BURK|nr:MULTISPECIES: dihydropteroate synthase [Ramlibacter]MBA2961294.1 dihydropteroate synthase [Ramlibacter sp. CGMCC 1.13660]MVQ31238.1 dihydropteroate synthase [Ramlibacter pinisoli]